jgi:capsular exopolysaccharide synthesis family protein
VIPSVKALARRTQHASILPWHRSKHDLAPVADGGASPVVAAWTDGKSFLAESFRSALTSLLRILETGKDRRMIMVTSPSPGEGKTTIASNLAVALAETGRRVLLVDTDFRRPCVHQVFNVPNEDSLRDLICSEIMPTDDQLRASLVPGPVPGLSLLVNETGDENVSRLLHSERFRDILERLRDQFDIVLLDTPPLLFLADARLMGPITDGVVLVLRAGVTDRTAALEACHRIQADGLPLLGTVLNDWAPGNKKMHRYSHYGYHE